MLRLPVRLLLAAALLVSLPACDTAEPGSADALVGSWTSEVRYSGFAATSRIDQEVADVTREARGGIEVTGDADAMLTYVHYAYPELGSSDGTGHAMFATRPQNDPSCRYPSDCPPYAFLQIWGGEDGLVFSEQTENETREYVGTGVEVGVDLQRTDMGFSLTPFTIPGRHTGRTITAGGEVEFQTAELRAGRPTPVATFHSSPDYGEYTTFDFRADGTFDYSIGYPNTTPSSASGTWSVTAPGIATLTSDRWTRQAAFEVRGRALWIVFPLSEAPASAETVAESEQSVFAEEGSLSHVSGGTVTVLTPTD